MRAIDLYAGIGGWSFGLKMAGVDVVHSYEWWKPALDTHNGNHSTNLQRIDIRTMNLDDLPDNIDLVVGSPPCTQFSYSNRGGSGDLADGQIDLVRFFAIVDKLKPKFWAMENVPRVAKFLEASFSDSASDLFKYRHLNPNIGVFDMSEFGCPQARRRCIATNLRLDDINEFRTKCPDLTLGDVINRLAETGKVVDPVWGVTLPADQVTEQQKEEQLNEEELRLNRDSKTFHPIYNNMSFPDRLDAPARTVTATCTRVSRESIVVREGRGDKFRRLTVRERASLQGFPITYQFYGRSFSEKIKMIGNAIPPTFTYILASVAQGIPTTSFVPHKDVGHELTVPLKTPPVTSVDTAGKSYPRKRRFRAAIPGLRFKSGMRFEFSNDVSNDWTLWSMRFYSGNSKEIRSHELDQDCNLNLSIYPALSSVHVQSIGKAKALTCLVESTTGDKLQDIWTRRQKGESPFFWADQLGEIADTVYGELLDRISPDEAEDIVLKLIGFEVFSGKYENEAKLRRNALRILSGVLVAVWFNKLLGRSRMTEAA